MNNHFGRVLLMAACLAAGFTFGSYQLSSAEQPSAVAFEDTDVATQLKEIKEIKSQVRDINNLLQSGKLRVVVVINPDAK